MTAAAEAERLTITDIASRLRVTRQTVYNWRDAGCPLDEGIPAIRDWLKQRNDARDPEEDDAKARLILAQAEKTEQEALSRRLDNEEREKATINRQQALLEFKETVHWLRAQWLAFPDELITELPAEARQVCYDAAKRKVEVMLRKLSQWKPESLRDA